MLKAVVELNITNKQLILSKKEKSKWNAFPLQALKTKKD
jgi:hypothetical protein